MSEVLNQIGEVYDSVKKKDLKIMLIEISATVVFLESCMKVKHPEYINKYLVQIIDGLRKQLEMINKRL